MLPDPPATADRRPQPDRDGCTVTVGAVRDAIAAAVEQRAPAALGLLETLVNMDSPTEDKALSDRVGELLAAKAAELGLACERERVEAHGDTWLCRHRSGGLGPRVLMVGHYDTVYPAGTAAERPFRISGDRALGPGILDMKGGLVVGLFALEVLRTVLGRFPFDLTLLFNGDEEVGSPRSRGTIAAEARRNDLALVLEPGRPGQSITIGRKGVGIFRIVILGREAHAGAEPEIGINSIVEAAHKILAVAALNDTVAGTTVTPGVIRGGTRPYVVPGETLLEIDCRVSAMSEQARIEAALAQIAAEARLPGTRGMLTGGFHRPPMEHGDVAARHVARLQEVAEAMGYPLGTATTGGASDGNLTAAAGTPTIDGLGVHGGRAHSPDEFMMLESLPAKTRVLAAFLADLAAGPPAPP